MSFSDWEMVDNGAWNGVRKYIRSSDEDHGTVQVRYEGYDIPIIKKRNVEAQNEWSGFGKGELHHAATIPVSVMLEWFQKDGIWATDDTDYMVRKLNDPDWAYLKRMPIRL